ncbi:UpxY family transcription antiterminator [Tenacibaculum sp. TC6]|uniref:UpxY family transcription antiterminator n=1 Tax=Tenacibaculum sp. TC6 TaxID=3423223 RepID=UPI003D36E24D
MNYTNGWHVIYVKSRWEKRVYESLKEISLEPFLPLTKTLRQWSDRKKVIFKPLIPSYVFVNLNSPKEFHKALSVDGACSFIRFGKEYAKVTDKEINNMKFLVEDQNIIDLETNYQIPKVGEVRKINYGSLQGLECEVLKVNNTNKIVVRIDSLQQNIIATVPANYIADVVELV